MSLFDFFLVGFAFSFINLIVSTISFFEVMDAVGPSLFSSIFVTVITCESLAFGSVIGFAFFQDTITNINTITNNTNLNLFFIITSILKLVLIFLIICVLFLVDCRHSSTLLRLLSHLHHCFLIHLCYPHLSRQ